MFYLKPKTMIKRSVLFILLLLAGLSLMAQKTVTGVVTEQNGQLMSGVTVVVKGTSAGALTGVDGKYTLTLPAGSITLSFSFIGFTTQDVVINDRSVINV